MSQEAAYLYGAIVVIEIATLMAVDIRRFEIDLAAAGRLIVLSLVWGGLHGVYGALDVLAGALLGLCLAYLTRLWSPSSLGLGDDWLYAAAGAVGGVILSPAVFILAGAFGILAARCYAIARGKARLFSAYPAAIAVGPAILAVLPVRLGVVEIPPGLEAILSPQSW